jgi:hypothetical protein
MANGVYRGSFRTMRVKGLLLKYANHEFASELLMKVEEKFFDADKFPLFAFGPAQGYLPWFLDDQRASSHNN